LAYSNTILNQFLTLVPRLEFENAVSAFHGDRYVKTFSTWNQLAVLLYTQASGKDSLREIQNGLASQARLFYHLGLPDGVAKSTLSDANASRDWHIYERLFRILYARCRDLTPKHKFRFKNPLVALDATSVEVALSVFPWAQYCKTKGALKLHYGLDYNGNIPCFLLVTDGKCHEVTAAKEQFPVSADSIYCFDRGYNDFSWFRRIHDSGAFFVTRAKNNLDYRITGQQLNNLPKGVMIDQQIALAGVNAAKAFPHKLRLVHYHDEETGRFFVFMTNNFTLSPTTIAQIYKARWQIEAFFKWIKQNLKIKSFLGTTQNAVRTQIWVASCYYLLLAYLKYQTKCAYSLYYLHALVKEALLERLSLIDLPNLTRQRFLQFKQRDNQLSFQF
jgi:plasmid maintenance system killer protein